ncbi:TspO/MBR family protein [Sphingomonas radiodurans]|uniref:TspO/MBR family protein n=1 Tax=Sphingomonas radiodurans TaxID=2890321 RepID=UPI001E3C53A3|nr:TspO/MBR family protein [Sphingomonas radiodurans]WBH15599.1 tryptophan-rich sensory protein [Sphingomonas radiodurans]
MTRASLFPIIIAGVIAMIVAVMGATVTDIGPWYRSLVQPSWSPPDVAYGIAWTVIYALTAMAGVRGWLAITEWAEREWLLGLFALNGFLNLLWSFLFFRLHRPDWALIEVIGLWLSVAALIIYVWRRSTTGGILLVPYLLWVTFAGYLNMTIVRLNGPFP